MIISAELTKRSIAYWAIFLLYAFAVTFFLLTFTRTVEKELTLTSIDIITINNSNL